MPIRTRIFRTIRTIWPKLILTFLAVGIIQSVSRDLRFYYDDKVVTVKSPGDVAKLRDNMLAEIQLPLEVKDAYWVKFHRSKREYELIPFVGVAYRLMWMVEGQMTERERARLKPPFKGRVVAKDGTAWRVQGKRMELEELFAKQQIKLLANTMVIYDAPKQLPNPGQLLLGAAGIAYLVWNGVILFRLFGKRLRQ